MKFLNLKKSGMCHFSLIMPDNSAIYRFKTQIFLSGTLSLADKVCRRWIRRPVNTDGLNEILMGNFSLHQNTDLGRNFKSSEFRNDYHVMVQNEKCNFNYIDYM